MKKIMLTVAGLMLTGALAVNAQSTQDTTRSISGSYQDKPTTGTQSGTKQHGQGGTGATGMSENWTKIEITEVPSTLRSTLQGTKYEGWEEGNVYRQKDNSGYIVEIGEGTDKKTYHFDRNGKLVSDKSGKGKDDQK